MDGYSEEKRSNPPVKKKDKKMVIKLKISLNKSKFDIYNKL